MSTSKWPPISQLPIVYRYKQEEMSKREVSVCDNNAQPQQKQLKVAPIVTDEEFRRMCRGLDPHPSPYYKPVDQSEVLRTLQILTSTPRTTRSRKSLKEN